MLRFEYKVIPAPRKGEKVKGARTSTDRFAHTLTQMMNELGHDGWEYLRAETLPCEERVGFTGKTTTFQNLLIFRRAIADEAAAGADTSGWHRHDGPPEPSSLAATLSPQAPGALRAPPVQAPEGHPPALGPARGGVAAG